MKEFRVLVKKCDKNCPAFRADNGNHCFYCTHPDTPPRNPVYNHREILQALVDEYTITTDFPDWCPLNEIKET